MMTSTTTTTTIRRRAHNNNKKENGDRITNTSQFRRRRRRPKHPLLIPSERSGDFFETPQNLLISRGWGWRRGDGCFRKRQLASLS